MGGRRRGLERAAMEGIPDRGSCVVFTGGVKEAVFGAPNTNRPACDGGETDSMHDRDVRGSYRRSGGEGEEPR